MFGLPQKMQFFTGSVILAPMSKAADVPYSKAETERRFTTALGRALSAPHKPHERLKAKAKKRGRTKARPKVVG
jgi:hypothetical protein